MTFLLAQVNVEVNGCFLLHVFGDVREIDDISTRLTTRSFKAVIPVGDLWQYQIGYVPVSTPCRNKGVKRQKKKKKKTLVDGWCRRISFEQTKPMACLSVLFVAWLLELLFVVYSHKSTDKRRFFVSKQKMNRWIFNRNYMFYLLTFVYVVICGSGVGGSLTFL